MAKKRTTLTVKEKKLNVQIRKELREEGILPPIKPKLNRKKFAEEMTKYYDENFNWFDDMRYLQIAIGAILPSRGTGFRQKISLEQIGVLKVVKLVKEIKKFHEEKKLIGEKTYKLDEIYTKVIGPILNL